MSDDIVPNNNANVGESEGIPEALQTLEADLAGNNDNRRWRYAMREVGALDYAGPGLWRQVGPSPLIVANQQVFQGIGPDSGEVVDIAIDPRPGPDRTIYIAAGSGGVWKSIDDGRSWRPITDHLPGTAIGAIALDPNNPDIVYVGTGNLFDGAAGMPKATGLFKSRDGGATWTRLTSPVGRPPQAITAATNVAGGVRVTVVGHGYSTSDRVAAIGLPGLTGPAAEGIATRIDSDTLRIAGMTMNAAYGGPGATLFDSREPPFLSDRGIVRMVCPLPDTLLVASATGLYLSRDGGRSFGANPPTFDDGRPIRNGFISALELDQGWSRVARVVDATPATPIVATVPSHGFVNGDQVVIGGVETNSAANGTWLVDRIDDDHFSLRNSAGNGAGAVSGFVIGPAHPSTRNVQAASNPAAPAPIVITSPAHGFITGDIVAISGVQGNTAANRSWSIRVLSPDTFSLVGSRGNAAHVPNTGTIEGPVHRPAAAIAAAVNQAGGVTATVAGHGFVDGDRVSVLGLPGIVSPANSASVHVLDANRFRLAGLTMSGAYGGAGATVIGPADSWNTAYFVSAGRDFGATTLNPDRGLFRLAITAGNDVVLSDNLLGHSGGVSGGFGRVAFAQATFPRTRTLYASVQDSEFAGVFIGLYRSDDFGANWTLRPGFASRVNLDGGGQSNYDLTLGVDPQNPQQVYASLQQLWRSTDGGRTWPLVTPVTGGGVDTLVGFGRSPSTTLVHWDHHELVFPPATRWDWAGGNPVAPTPFYVGTDGGIARAGVDETQQLTVNATGGTFTLTFGGQTTPPIAFNATAQTVQAALQALSTMLNVRCDGGPCATAPVAITFVGTLAGATPALITADATSLTGGTQTAAVSGLVDMMTFTALNEGIATSLLRHIDIGRGAGNNAATFGGMQDTGTAGHRPNDAGAGWTAGIDGDGGFVAVDPFDPDIVFGFNDGLLIRTTNGGQTWFDNTFSSSPQIVSVMNENPVRVVTTGHPFKTGDGVVIANVPGGAGLANGNSAIHVLNKNEFTLDGKNGTAVAAFGTGPIATGGRYLTQTPITAATIAAPIEVETASPHGCVNGNRVRIDGVEGVFAANNSDTQPTWIVTVISPTRLSLDGSDGTASAPYTSGTGRLRGPQVNGSVPIQRAENANPIVVTAQSHGFMSGETVTIAGVLGNTNANGAYPIRVLDANSFVLVGRAGNAPFGPRPTVIGPGVGRTLPQWPAAREGFADRRRVALVPNPGAAATTIFVSFDATLFRSTDGGLSFTQINAFADRVSTLHAPANNRLWVGLAGRASASRPGRVLFSNNNGTSFHPAPGFVNDVGALGAISSIAEDPAVAGGAHVAVVVAGYSEIGTPRRTRHCFVTNSGGIRAGGAGGPSPWTEVGGVFNAGTGNLPDIPVMGVAWDTSPAPQAPSTLLVASDSGVLQLGPGAVWQRVGPNLPNVSCQALAVDNTVVNPRATPPVRAVVRVGTYGRSAWELTFPAGASLYVEGDLGFGEQQIGTTVRRRLVLHSVGSDTVTVAHIDGAIGDISLEEVGGGALGVPIVLTSGERRGVDVVFAPTAAGDRGTALTVASDDPVTPTVELPVTGFGIAAGRPRLSVRAFLEFGLVRVSVPAAPVQLPLEIRNVGTAPLTVDHVHFDLAGSDRFTFAAPPALPLVIAPGDAVSVPVQFNPNAGGQVRGSLLIDGSGQGAAVHLVGSGTTTAAGLIAALFDALGLSEPEEALA